MIPLSGGQKIRVYDAQFPDLAGGVWIPIESNRNWVSVAAAADGTKLVACVYGGQIYTNDMTGGYLTASQGSTIELLYVGADSFLTLRYVGSLVGP
jgi:hypothetical protein